MDPRSEEAQDKSESIINDNHESKEKDSSSSGKRKDSRTYLRTEEENGEDNQEINEDRHTSARQKTNPDFSMKENEINEKIKTEVIRGMTSSDENEEEDNSLLLEEENQEISNNETYSFSFLDNPLYVGESSNKRDKKDTLTEIRRMARDNDNVEPPNKTLIQRGNNGVCVNVEEDFRKIKKKLEISKEKKRKIEKEKEKLRNDFLLLELNFKQTKEDLEISKNKTNELQTEKIRLENEIKRLNKKIENFSSEKKQIEENNQKIKKYGDELTQNVLELMKDNENLKNENSNLNTIIALRLDNKPVVKQNFRPIVSTSSNEDVNDSDRKESQFSKKNNYKDLKEKFEKEKKIMKKKVLDLENKNKNLEEQLRNNELKYEEKYRIFKENQREDAMTIETFENKCRDLKNQVNELKKTKQIEVDLLNKKIKFQKDKFCKKQEKIRNDISEQIKVEATRLAKEIIQKKEEKRRNDLELSKKIFFEKRKVLKITFIGAYGTAQTFDEEVTKVLGEFNIQARINSMRMLKERPKPMPDAFLVFDSSNLTSHFDIYIEDYENYTVWSKESSAIHIQCVPSIETHPNIHVKARDTHPELKSGIFFDSKKPIYDNFVIPVRDQKFLLKTKERKELYQIEMFGKVGLTNREEKRKNYGIRGLLLKVAIRKMKSDYRMKFGKKLDKKTFVKYLSELSYWY